MLILRVPADARCAAIALSIAEIVRDRALEPRVGAGVELHVPRGATGGARPRWTLCVTNVTIITMADTTRTRPDRLCDIVMKGGVTSGVVYPSAVAALAEEYRLKCIGGTSAGAIAAAGAAAAEYGRESGGFERLSALPQWMGRDRNLLSLFQPQPATKRLFRVVLAFIAGGPRSGIAAALRQFPLAALIGAVPGLALAAIVLAEARDNVLVLVAGLVAALLLILVGAAAVVAWRLARVALRAVPANGFGLCSGLEGDVREPRSALTPWLYAQIEALAGGAERDGPLTFGDLWAGPDGDRATADPDDPWLRLEMMTTNVTNRRAERLPQLSSRFFFEPDGLRRVFPDAIVEWLEQHPPALPTQPAARRGEQLLRGLLWPLRPLPEAADLPVVVATRMSLSFPVLLSAVPLHRVDWTLRANGGAWKAWEEWIEAHPDEWSEVADDPSQIAALAGAPAHPVADVCWFSDGGITSNFPVHFFDALLPRRPTFGLNLRSFHPSQPRSTDERENTWMVQRHRDGIVDWWYPFDDVRGFLEGVMRTMQNRVDEAQMRLPGYRDRVVHVSVGDDEGGLNLDMPDHVITNLGTRGRHAGERLVERFGTPPANANSLSWDDHRWVRYRSLTASLATAIRQFAAVYGDPAEPYRDLVRRGQDEYPGSYRLTGGQQAAAEALSDDLVRLAATLEAMAALDANAPSPPPVVRVVPPDAAPRRRPDVQDAAEGAVST